MASAERRCCGCRKVRLQEEMIRLTLSPEGSVTSSPGGRGVYVCPTVACVERAVKTKAIARGLKSPGVSLTSPDLLQAVGAGARRKVAALVGLARRAGKVILGRERVEESLSRGVPPDLVLVASDAPAAVSSHLCTLMDRQGLPCLAVLTREELGRALGRAEVVAVGITDRHFAQGIWSYSRLLGETAAGRDGRSPLGGQ